MRNRFNALYDRLGEEISTVLAVAQIDQVLGKNSTVRSSPAPYYLKSLNQLTLIAFNAFISRNRFTEEQTGKVTKNVRFIRSQMHLLDNDKRISPLFEELLLQMDSLDTFIASLTGVYPVLTCRFWLLTTGLKKLFERRKGQDDHRGQI